MEKYAKASLFRGTKNKDTKGRMLVLRSYFKRKNKEKQTNQTTQTPLKLGNNLLTSENSNEGCLNSVYAFDLYSIVK